MVGLSLGWCKNYENHKLRSEYSVVYFKTVAGVYQSTKIGTERNLWKYFAGIHSIYAPKAARRAVYVYTHTIQMTSLD